MTRKGQFSAVADRTGRYTASSASRPVHRVAGVPAAPAISGDTQAARRATEFFRDAIEFVEQDLSLEERRCVPEALLGNALARLIARDGRDETAAVLTSLADAISSGAILSAGWPARPTRTDGKTRPGFRPEQSGTVVQLR